jgi:hypothetical protein
MWLLSAQMNNSCPFIKAKFYWFFEEKAFERLPEILDAREVTSPCPQIEISNEILRPELVGVVQKKKRFAGTLSINNNYTFDCYFIEDFFLKNQSIKFSNPIGLKMLIYPYLRSQMWSLKLSAQVFY